MSWGRGAIVSCCEGHVLLCVLCNEGGTAALRTTVEPGPKAWVVLVAAHHPLLPQRVGCEVQVLQVDASRQVPGLEQPHDTHLGGG